MSITTNALDTYIIANLSSVIAARNHLLKYRPFLSHHKIFSRVPYAANFMFCKQIYMRDFTRPDEPTMAYIYEKIDTYKDDGCSAKKLMYKNKDAFALYAIMNAANNHNYLIKTPEMYLSGFQDTGHLNMMLHKILKELDESENWN